ncbi:ATP-binding protein, partial [Arenibacter sp. F20364]|uniref:ATP-binding protein n=1 Tax=Arenibacter sp. F20364 TaxID=2926415 RepID=UPI001FF1B1B5
NLDRNMFARLGTLDFMARKENIILTGASGTGKSYLAQALGHQACMMEHRAIYANTARLFKRLKLCKVDGTYLKELDKILKTDLLILDDFGLQSFDNHAREALMDIIDDRYNKASTIIASQIPVSAWYDIIGESTIADAILDRIVNSSHRLDLKGESLRKGIIKNA